MKLCILDNDILDSHLAQTYGSFGNLFTALFDRVGARWDTTVFQTQMGQYPASFDDFDAVLLTGSRADCFSEDAWVVELRRQVRLLLEQNKKMVGVCFGHQLIALCLGAPVGRAPQGWGVGCMTYDWHDRNLPAAKQRSEISLLASHQDQVHALPPGAELIASNAFCPVAAFRVNNHIFCVQAHPEFNTELSAHLLKKRRALLGEEKYARALLSLTSEHEGDDLARMVVAFMEAD